VRLKADKKKSIANIFIRFSHRDMDGMVLTNKNEKKIVKEINAKLKDKIANCAFVEESNTFIPYYDSILDEEKKSNLVEVRMTEICADKVKRLGIKTSFYNKKELAASSSPLIEFVPKKSCKSEILNDYQISNLCAHLQPMLRTKDWELVFSINKDGVSVGTFYDRCRTW
jgi:hypothetical protein